MNLSENLKDHLLKVGFERKLPYQYHNQSYIIVDNGVDSNGFPVWVIENKRFVSTSYRGIIKDKDEFDFIFTRIKEDYDRTKDEIEELKQHDDWLSLLKIRDIHGLADNLATEHVRKIAEINGESPWIPKDGKNSDEYEDYYQEEFDRYYRFILETIKY